MSPLRCATTNVVVCYSVLRHVVDRSHSTKSCCPNRPLRNGRCIRHAFSGCEDTGYVCSYWKWRGWCERSSDYAVNSCTKTCGFCPTLAPPTAHRTTATSGATAKGSGTPTSTKQPSSTPTSLPDQRPNCRLPSMPLNPDVFMDMVLSGHVINTWTVISEIQCEDYCLRSPKCVAFNYHDVNGRHFKCELLDIVKSYGKASGSRFRLFDRTRSIKSILGTCRMEI
ncbi:uncharacterized protein LOC116614773 isoform X3 [Nematostella vectensis]|uniref:uncharacterized protein LOC116614773 isoform X3 n=1 Tax=Nematostella vectensis TaxID=45351 RepID=UPI0020771139|nr:uncharacterized protein LOC116614773 isoform X3 [Nematostella vectensis]